MLCLVAQLCLTLCDPMNCSPLSSSVHGDSPGKNTGVDCHALLQEIFPTQESNQSLLHCRGIHYQLNYQGSPNKYINNVKSEPLAPCPPSLLFPSSPPRLPRPDSVLLCLCPQRNTFLLTSGLNLCFSFQHFLSFLSTSKHPTPGPIWPSSLSILTIREMFAFSLSFCLLSF